MLHQLNDALYGIDSSCIHLQVQLHEYAIHRMVVPSICHLIFLCQCEKEESIRQSIHKVLFFFDLNKLFSSKWNVEYINEDVYEIYDRKLLKMVTLFWLFYKRDIILTLLTIKVFSIDFIFFVNFSKYNGNSLHLHWYRWSECVQSINVYDLFYFSLYFG